MVKFELDVADGSRTVRYNVSDRNVYTANGVTTGVITEFDPGSNPASTHSRGNRHFTVNSPIGTTVTGNISKNIADATGDQVITGLGFRPVYIEFDGILSSVGNANARGYTDCTDVTPASRGVYYYNAGTQWAEAGANTTLVFRTAAGDIMSGVVTAVGHDGFTITWTKTGSPTGTAAIKYTARR
jgi:hypothetical protein